MKTLQLHDHDGKYYYDPEAAERPIRFIEKYCQHWEGRFAGQPFTLLDWQRQIIRTLFGWKRTADKFRRFRELFLLTAKGAGKTPLISAIGLFMLIGSGEAAPHVISMASSFEQANLTFDAGKKYIALSPPLNARCQRLQYRITVPKTFGQWTLISGKPTGRSGSRPTCLIADEVHEWEGPTAKAFNLITANLIKRQEPLTLIATNAPALSTSFAAQLYERAVAVVEGRSAEETLLPVIYETPREMDWTGEPAARAANPSIPDIITYEQLRPQIAKARESDADEAEYRRLYLSQQTQAAARWLDVRTWDACCQPIDPAAIKDAVAYVGIDLSQGDDLSAVTYVWVTPERMYVDAEFWLPRSTAERYDQTAATQYVKWAAEGHINLVDEPTISPAIKRAIAQRIHERTKAHKVKAVCYDRYKADDAVAALEAAQHVCVPVGQGWGVSRGCEELDRRLKERSIIIAPNPVLRACAEVVEIKSDDRGNYWPVKPNAKGQYKGRRSAKIDGIAALVTCLTEARKHSFPSNAKKWTGQVYVM